MSICGIANTDSKLTKLFLKNITVSPFCALYCPQAWKILPVLSLGRSLIQPLMLYTDTVESVDKPPVMITSSSSVVMLQACLNRITILFIYN